MLKVKTEVIKRSEVLELMPQTTIEEVGGLEVYKQWITKRASCFTEEAFDFGVPIPKGFALIGVPRCISGDTKMLYRRGARFSSREIAMKALYHKFNGNKWGKPWNLNHSTFLHSFDSITGTIFYNEIVNVFSVGVQSVVKLTTRAGRQIILTANHPILTRDGFKPVSSLRSGDILTVRGSMRASPAAIRRGRTKRGKGENLRYYSAGHEHRRVDHSAQMVYDYRRQSRARLVIEAEMNSLSYAEYIYRLKNDPTAIHLKVLGSEFDVHHIDKNPLNDSRDNLRVMLGSDHDRLHADERNFNVEYTTYDEVESITLCGREAVFDVQMKMPANNFATANGFLTLNTGTSF